MKRPRWHHVVLGVLALVGAVAFFRQNDGAGPRAQADGRYYYIYLRSLAVDHDIDLGNDYQLDAPAFGFKNYYGFGRTATGRAANPFGIGPALLWLPFFLVARFLAWLRHVFGAGPQVMDPLSAFHQTVTLFGTYVAACLAVWLTCLTGTRLASRGSSLLGVLAFALASPFVFYAIWVPSYAHVLGAGAVAAAVWYWYATQERRDLRRYLILGALAGLAGLARPQNLLVLLLPAADLATALWRERRAGPRPALRLVGGGAACLLAAVLVFLPQLLAWRATYGQWFLTPQGPGFMRWGESLWMETLFSPRNGLLTYTPLALGGLVGLILLARSERRIGLPLLLLFLVYGWANGAAFDWWAGGSFGARRYVDIFPVLALGLVHVLDRVRRWLEARPRATAAALLVLALVPCVAVNLAEVDLFLVRGAVAWNEVISTRTRYRSATSRLIDRVFDAVGNPLQLPASAFMAARFGVPLERYDEVSGRYLLVQHHRGAHPGLPPRLRDVLSFSSPEGRLHLGRGWLTAIEPDGAGRAVLGTTSGPIMVPLVEPAPIRLTFVARGTAGDAAFVEVNGGPRLPLDVPAEWQAVSVDVPQASWRRGMNELVVERGRHARLELRSIGLTRR